MLTAHVIERLETRNIHVNPRIIAQIADNVNGSAAVLLMTLDSHVGSIDNNYYARSESNGNMVYLIIRDNHPITIMFRRDNQPNTPESMRVNAIIDLSTDLQNLIKVLQ